MKKPKLATQIKNMTPLNTPIEVINEQRKSGTETADCITLMFEMLNQGIGSARVLGINDSYVAAALMDRGVEDAIWYSDNAEIDHIIEGHPLVRKEAPSILRIKNKPCDLLMVNTRLLRESKRPERYIRSVFSGKAKKIAAFYYTQETLVNVNALVGAEFDDWELWRMSGHNFGILVYKKK